MLWIYGIITFLSAISVFLFIKEYPDGYVRSGSDERQKFSEGVRHILGNHDMRITLLLFLIGLGIFNAVSSMTDSISEAAGAKDSDGLVGGIMLIGGIFGALILPALSDRYRRRKIFLVICLIGMVPGIFGLAFAGNIGLDPGRTYNLLLISSFITGFFVMSAGPIGFQYAAEVSFPAPESASQGMLLWVGQLSGMIFVALMSIHGNRHLGFFMGLFAFLTLLALAAVLFLRESPMIQPERKRIQ